MTKQGLQRHQRKVAALRIRIEREQAQRSADVHQYLAIRASAMDIELCPKCGAGITETDKQAGHCTQCRGRL